MKRYITAILNHFRFRRLREIERSLAGLEVKARLYSLARKGEGDGVPIQQAEIVIACQAEIASLKVERRQIREALARAGVALVAD